MHDTVTELDWFRSCQKKEACWSPSTSQSRHNWGKDSLLIVCAV